MMKRMATFLVVLALAVVAATGTVFAAGQQQTAAGGTSLDTVSPNGAEVTFWHQHSGIREEGFRALVDEFNRTNEWRITVNAEYGGSYGEIYNKMITGLAGNSVPEMVVAYQNQSAVYQVADGLVDLNPYVNHPQWGIPAAELRDFFPGFIAQDVNAQFDNQRLGFPTNRSVEVLYYNQTWLERLGFDGPPTTWEQFEQMARAATDPAAGTYGYAIRTDASSVYAMAISRGGEIAKPDGSGYTFSIPEVRDSLALIKRMLDAGTARKIAERYGDQSDFGNGLTLFTMGSSSGLPFYEQAVQAGSTPFEWNVAPLPTTLSKPVVNIYGASISVTKTTLEKQLAAWLFIRWLSSVEMQRRWVEISNYFPVRISVREQLGDYLANDPKYDSALSILINSDTKAEPPYAGYDEVRNLAAGAFNAVLDGENIDAVLQNLDTQANTVHRDAAP